MKIAIVCNNLSFIAGGPRLVFRLADEMQRAGHTVVVYSPDYTSGTYYDEVAKGLDIRVVASEHAREEKAPPKGIVEWVTRKIERERDDIHLAKKIAREMDPDFDVVNVHDFAYRTGYFYKQLHPKAKIVWHENAPIFVYVKRNNIVRDILGTTYNAFKEWTNTKYFKAIDVSIVLDHFNEKWSRDHGFKHIALVRAGIDFEKFYAPVKDFKEKASRKEVNLLAVGALNAYRRFDNVVEAVHILREQGYDARAKIVANNIWHEDKCIEDLRSLVKKYDLEQYVHFNFEGMPEADIIKAFQNTDIFVQAVYSPPPSHHGWGLVNFEAMAAGVPVVLVGSATATEVLKDGETALFFEPLHFEQIAEKIKFLVDHPDAYQRIAAAGQKYVKENQSWKRYAAEVLEAFSKY